jgi:hypothetical protein
MRRPHQLRQFGDIGRDPGVRDIRPPHNFACAAAGCSTVLMTPPEQLSAVMTGMPIMVGRHSSNRIQLELGCGGNNIEPGLALDAYRLQSK